MGIPIKLTRTGNNWVFPVPDAFVKTHGLENVEAFEMEWRDGTIVITSMSSDDTAAEDALIQELFEDFGPQHVRRDLLPGGGG